MIAAALGAYKAESCPARCGLEPGASSGGIGAWEGDPREGEPICCAPPKPSSGSARSSPICMACQSLCVARLALEAARDDASMEESAIISQRPPDA